MRHDGGGFGVQVRLQEAHAVEGGGQVGTTTVVQALGRIDAIGVGVGLPHPQHPAQLVHGEPSRLFDEEASCSANTDAVRSLTARDSTRAWAVDRVPESTAEAVRVMCSSLRARFTIWPASARRRRARGASHTAALAAPSAA